MISKLCTKRSQTKTEQKSPLFSAALLLLTAFLLNSVACAHKPVDTRFDGKWEACEVAPQKTMMCLDEDDIGKLRKLLLQCGAQP